ncbi:MAG: S53 family serine peptidase [Terracidiphilus sp.]
MRFVQLASSAMLASLAAVSFSVSNPAQAAEIAKILGPADQSAIAHFNVYLPLTHQDALDKLVADQTDPASASYHHWLTPAQFKEQFGPNPVDVVHVKAALQSAGFTVLKEETQSLEVEGPVSAVERAFSTRLNQVQLPGGHVKLEAEGDRLTLPDVLVSAGAVVPEFTNHLMAHVHSERAARDLVSSDPLFRLSSSDSLFYPNDLNEAYQLPSFRTEAVPAHGKTKVQIAGVGAHIGIVMSSVIDPSDLADTFNSTLDLSGGEKEIQAYSANSNLPVPKVTIRKVDGGSGSFSASDDAALEASLDTQMSLGTAPGAKETLYNIPDLSDDHVADGYKAVVEDNSVDVVSSSFGQCELYFTAAYGNNLDYPLKVVHSLFVQGNAQGITFLASSGDNGAVPCVSAAFYNNGTPGTSFVPGVEWPAADPNVTGVGGTNLQTTATPGVNDADYKSENANFDPLEPAEFQVRSKPVSVKNNTWGSGGGYSKIFAKPSYQKLVSTGSSSERSVPDVALMMGGCPNGATNNCGELPRSAAIIWIGGEAFTLIGTSSSSPEMAAVLALAVELNGGRLGNVNPMIYQLSAKQSAAGKNPPPDSLIFHREISGNNNLYKVSPGQAYSTVLGNSTLYVQNFLGLSSAAAAGAPDTSSNP